MDLSGEFEKGISAGGVPLKKFLNLGSQFGIWLDELLSIGDGIYVTNGSEGRIETLLRFFPAFPF
jgi:hypothetical protein